MRTIYDRIEHFINKSKKKFGDKYDFPFIENEYTGSHSKITIKCKECGSVFIKIALDHLTSSNGGCKHCRLNHNKQNITYNELLKYNSNLKFFDDIKDIRKDSVTLLCPVHGEYISPIKSVISNKCRCRKCVLMNSVQKYIRISKEEANKRLAILCNNKFSFNIDEYQDTQTPLELKCLSCNGVFKRDLNSLTYNVCCPICNNMSVLEHNVKILFDNNGIKYEYQKRFKWLGKKSLDFYLPDYSVVIECQGIQHFEPVEYFGGEKEFKVIKERDELKRNLCEEHGIKVLYYSDLNVAFRYTLLKSTNELLNEIKKYGKKKDTD